MALNLSSVFKVIKESKGKIVIFVGSAVAFLFVLFPFDDLSDLISNQVSKLTNNALFLQFDHLNMSLYPQPGVQMDQVYVESQVAPAISVSELTITPSVSGLIQKQPYGSISAKGLLKGDVEFHLGKGTRGENVDRQRIEIKAKKISLNDVREMANIPFLLKGQVDLSTIAMADLTFTEQPDIDVDLSIKNFELPPSNVNTPMGPLTLPDLKLSTIELKGRLAAGKFIIESGTIGKPNDELYGTIKGNMGLTLVARGGGAPAPQLGGYDLEVDLKTKANFQSRAGLFLMLLDNHKTTTSEGAQYKFKLSASNPLMPPSIGPAR